MPQAKEHHNVILMAVDSNFFIVASDSLYSAIYFVTPVFIPPHATVIIIDEKLLNCPSNAIPEGPIIKATIFTLINPVSILTNVDIAVKEKTFTISVFKILPMT